MTTSIASTIIFIVKKSKLLTFPQDEKGLEEFEKIFNGSKRRLIKSESFKHIGFQSN
jgi:hypothetical protein